jgi:hypothetical protein
MSWGLPRLTTFSRVSLPGATTPYFHLDLDLDLGGVTFDGGGVSKPPLRWVWLRRLRRLTGLFACGTLCEAGGSLRRAVFQSSPSSQTSESVFGARPTSLRVA